MKIGTQIIADCPIHVAAGVIPKGTEGIVVELPKHCSFRCPPFVCVDFGGKDGEDNRIIVEKWQVKGLS